MSLFEFPVVPEEARGKSKRPATQRTGKAGPGDWFQTDPAALKPLLPYLPKDAVIWECAAGKRNLVRGLEGAGHHVIATDTQDDPPRDFLEWVPDERWDVIVTNPPFSRKDAFLARCYELGNPFALLLPYTVFDSEYRQGLFKKNGVDLIIFPGRVDFETPSGKVGGSWFGTCWVTWQLFGASPGLHFWTANTQ